MGTEVEAFTNKTKIRARYESVLKDFLALLKEEQYEARRRSCQTELPGGPQARVPEFDGKAQGRSSCG